MKKSRYTEEQVAYTLRLAESGTPVADVCRQMGIAEATYRQVYGREPRGCNARQVQRFPSLGSCYDASAWSIDAAAMIDVNSVRSSG
ncbi:MAG: transposase [Acidobacteria bacterium]|nr:transposase [Acidobacteriota bacterium]